MQKQETIMFDQAIKEQFNEWKGYANYKAIVKGAKNLIKLLHLGTVTK